jgi:hypothetical protein
MGKQLLKVVLIGDGGVGKVCKAHEAHTMYFAVGRTVELTTKSLEQEKKKTFAAWMFLASCFSNRALVFWAVCLCAYETAAWLAGQLHFDHKPRQRQHRHLYVIR